MLFEQKSNKSYTNSVKISVFNFIQFLNEDDTMDSYLL